MFWIFHLYLKDILAFSSNIITIVLLKIICVLLKKSRQEETRFTRSKNKQKRGLLCLIFKIQIMLKEP